MEDSNKRHHFQWVSDTIRIANKKRKHAWFSLFTSDQFVLEY
jgi:hypothetical protein